MVWYTRVERPTRYSIGHFEDGDIIRKTLLHSMEILAVFGSLQSVLYTAVVKSDTVIIVTGYRSQLKCLWSHKTSSGD